MALKYLLDTNVISEPLRARPDEGVMEKLRLHEAALCTSAVVWHEMSFGAVRLPEGPKRQAIERFLDDVVLPTLPLLPYDGNAAAWHADERARLEKKGRTPPFVDGMIAAVAKVHGLILVTDNLADYENFDLVVERWHTR